MSALPRKQAPDAEQELFDQLVALAGKPYDFVYWAFDWGGPGLEDQEGPDIWQQKVLWDLQMGLVSFEMAIQGAIRSGHGVGKSALFSWLILWAMSTKEDTRGRVTANTKEQLMRVLWGELAKWHNLFIAKHLFKVTATAIFSADSEHEKTWRIDAIPWSKDNPEAFAGLHNYGKRLLYLFDEASAIPDSIWEVMDGATTDSNTEIIWYVAGNPTRNAGRFRDCWDKFDIANDNEEGLWHTYKVDARTCKLPNKKLIEKWRRSYGADSDFFRIRVKGDFPNASTEQLFPTEVIRLAMTREVQSQPWESLVAGLDVARYGPNANAYTLRRGKDARTPHHETWSGLSIIETGQKLVNLTHVHTPDATFVDEGGLGGGVVDYARSVNCPVIGINFGSKPGFYPDGTRVKNKRSEMLVTLLLWMKAGGCIENDEDLFDEFCSIEYSFDSKEAIAILSKEDMKVLGHKSPDRVDSHALTFALPISPRAWRSGEQRKVDYDPLSWDKVVEGVEPREKVKYPPGMWR